MGADGAATLTLDGATVAVVSTPSTMAEPVAIGPLDGSVVVKLWSRVGEDGQQRQTMHFGGDVMLATRRSFWSAWAVSPSA